MHRTVGPEKRVNPEGHAQGLLVPVLIRGVTPLYIVHNLIFGQGPLPVTGNDIIHSQTVHHSFAVVAHSAMGGAGYPLVNVAHRLNV